MFYELKGTVKYRAGVSGSESFATGARILKVLAIGAGTVTMPANGSPSDPVTITTSAAAWFVLDEHHVDHVLAVAGDIVFADTTGYLVEYLDAAGQS